MRLEKSEETASEGRKRLSQSGNKAQWQMCLAEKSEVAESHPILSDPMDCSLPGSSIHGIFRARVLEWGAFAFSVNSMKRQNDRILKEELPRSLGAQYATGDQWRNNSRKNERMES